jgi:cytochrome c6
MIVASHFAASRPGRRPTPWRRLFLVPGLALLLAGSAVAADIGAGGRVYSMHCLACHGPSGQSLLPDAPNFVRGERLIQPDFSLLSSIKAGKRAMPAYMGILRDQEILDVVAYLRTLQR